MMMMMMMAADEEHHRSLAARGIESFALHPVAPSPLSAGGNFVIQPRQGRDDRSVMMATMMMVIMHAR